MIIAIASGKGGTGKTTVASALANSATRKINLFDCDVEEPNLHFFLKLNSTEIEEKVVLPVPVINENKCIGCREYFNFCNFKAIVMIKNKAQLINEMCPGFPINCN